MKKRKDNARDLTAPKQPLSGWVRYMNDRRDSIRAGNPNISFSEITKLLANEWNQLPQEQKQHYLDAAEQEREKYVREMAAYKQTEAYRQFNETKMKKKMKTSPHEDEFEKDSPEMSACDIPIFTEEFLEFNRARETELRQLRKVSMDLEQQNSILNKHVDTMKQTTAKLKIENMERYQSNNLLKAHLQKLREKLTEKLAGIPLPNTNELPSSQNIDRYVEQLHTLVQDNANESLVNRINAALADVDGIF